ncbi:MAG: DUF1844 domain-containing protein [Candidatus Omnitrophota bacterium]
MDADAMKKKVDESWKEAVDKERSASQAAGHEEVEATFGLFISSIMMQCLIALGEIENPLTKKKDENMQQARFLIDTLGMIKEKTANNLTKDEAETLEAMLYELRMRFVNKTSS